MQEGVLGSTGGGWKVTLSSGMILSIAASTGDGAVVQGDSITAQGLYYVPVHSGAITETVAAAHATLPRIDQVILEVLDANHDGGASNLARVRILAGTATAGATLDNRTGATALPNSTIRLADVLVPAAAASILAGNIRDRRLWARGACSVYTRTAGDYTSTSTSLVDLDATNIAPRVECSGVPLRVGLAGRVIDSASTAVIFALLLDGTQVFSSRGFNGGATETALSGEMLGYTFQPTAGSHILKVQWQTASAGTMTLKAGATDQLSFTIREEVRQNANNT